MGLSLCAVRPCLICGVGGCPRCCGSVPLLSHNVSTLQWSILVFRSNVPRGEEELHARRRDDVHARDQRCDEHGRLRDHSYV